MARTCDSDPGCRNRNPPPAFATSEADYQPTQPPPDSGSSRGSSSPCASRGPAKQRPRSSQVRERGCTPADPSPASCKRWVLPDVDLQWRSSFQARAWNPGLRSRRGLVSHLSRAPRCRGGAGSLRCCRARRNGEAVEERAGAGAGRGGGLEPCAPDAAGQHDRPGSPDTCGVAGHRALTRRDATGCWLLGTGWSWCAASQRRIGPGSLAPPSGPCRRSEGRRWRGCGG